MTAPKAVPAGPAIESANDRLKHQFSSWFWGSMIAATLMHFGTFAFWPELTAEDFSLTAEVLEAIELPPEIEIPPPPQQISRPATPVMATADIDEDITIKPTTFGENPVDELPPPPEEQATDLSAQPTFTPYTVAPEILNRQEVVRAMEREYPPLLRDASIGGQVVVFFFIDENGVVQDFRVEESSEHQAFIDAALAVAGVYRFSAALNRDKKVPVWVQFPIRFLVR